MKVRALQDCCLFLQDPFDFRGLDIHFFLQEITLLLFYTTVNKQVYLPKRKWLTLLMKRSFRRLWTIFLYGRINMN